MLSHKGTEQLETQNLILRKFRFDDAEDMFINWANDERVTKYLSWYPHNNKQITEEFIDSLIKSYDSPETYFWAIVPKDYNKVIGSISVIEFSNNMSRCEIGYCLSMSFWNMGIMTEALKAVIEFLLNEIGFERVQAKHDIANPASGKVMKKAGMQYEGRLRKYQKTKEGKLVTCDMYSSIRE
ncbi:MAG: GNAT family N-acetyltransferase [Firmicutes bacterium]|jgi:ribosomal-protein-alanine N-acetyltransferase|nr:GNAT family N-acetyltransferase [Bacillota bacterium]